MNDVHTITIELVGSNPDRGKMAPLLAPKGVNLQNFTKELGDHPYSKKFPGKLLRTKTVVTKSTKKFKLSVKTTPTSQLICEVTGIAKGSSNPGRDVVGNITAEQILAIAKIKHLDEVGVTNTTLFAMCRSVEGTARSRGLRFTGTWNQVKQLIEEGR
jgi:large subunit ribosomal protein L11